MKTYCIITALLLFAPACPGARGEKADRPDLLEDKLSEASFYASNYRLNAGDRLIQDIANDFTSSELARVKIDGYNGNFIVEAGLTAGFVAKSDWTNAVRHGECALKYRTLEGASHAPERLSRLLMDLSRAYDSRCFRRYHVADEYSEWALDLDADNAQLQQKIALQMFKDARRNKDDEEAERILRAAIASHGFAKRIVYRALGEFLWRERRGEEAFALWLDALRDVRLDFHENNRELGIEYLEKTMAVATEDQLIECEALLETLPARYPATIKNAAAIAGLLKASESRNLKDELFLRKAASERTEKMEDMLRRFIVERKDKRSRARLYLGDNLMARGFETDAMDVWLDAFAERGGARLRKSGEDWFSDRIDAHIEGASSNQIDRYARELVRFAGTNMRANARARMAVGDKLMNIGRTEKAIDIWLDGLAARRRPWLNKPEGDWFMQKLDTHAASLTPSRKKRYTAILREQMDKWKNDERFADAIPWLRKKLEKPAGQ